MADVLIIAFVVVGVVLATRSIARSFSTGKCAGCSKAKGCRGNANLGGAKSDGSCPACEAALKAAETQAREAFGGRA